MTIDDSQVELELLMNSILIGHILASAFHVFMNRKVTNIVGVATIIQQYNYNTAQCSLL